MPFTAFHISGPVMQKPSHNMYKLVDWSRVDAGLYATVDPMDPHAILYLSEKEYKVQVRVSLSQDSSLVVLARPGDQVLASDAPPSNTNSTSKSEDKDGPSSKYPPTLSELVGKGKNQVWKKFLSWHLSSLRGLTGAKNKKRGDSKASVSLSAAVLRTLIPYWGLDLMYRLGGDLVPSRALVRALREFADRMVFVMEKHGVQYLIVKMKSTLFVLNKYLAGTPTNDPWLLGQPVGLSKAGIPSFIPHYLRRKVAAGETNAIRMIISILNGYRAFDGSHDPQELETIRGPHPELDPLMLEEFKNFCEEVFWPKVIAGHLGPKIWSEVRKCEFGLTDEAAPYIPARAGPNSKFALYGAPADAIAWSRQPVNWMLEWCRVVNDTRTPELYSQCLSRCDWEKIFLWCSDDRDLPVQLRIGKVQCLPEPAGKVRTIAIVDYWTQRVLSPVHNWMMTVLRHLPTDGTFDQEGALQSFVRQLNANPTRVYSIDLKSATDLIPQKLYSVVFGALWGAEKADAWMRLMTDRWFYVPAKEKLVRPYLRGCSIRYGRGQPMGSLSSWPSMALVHHALELFAAQRAGKNPCDFTDYRILGDDNVTAGPDVADSYITVTTALAVPTSIAKTLDGDLFVFAQQIYLRGENISPLSLKEELGITSYGQRLEIALRAIRRGWLDNGLSMSRFLRLLLTRKDYSSSVREWSEGRLGKIAQSALISAFCIARDKVLTLLGFRESGIKPFIHAIKNNVTALAGDQGPTSRRTSVRRYAIELERALCVRLATDLDRKAQKLLRELEVSWVRFKMWKESIDASGFLPLATLIRPILNKRDAPSEPGILYTPDNWPKETLRSKLDRGEIPGFPDLSKGKFPIEIPHPITGAANMRSHNFWCEEVSHYHRALWLVIHDSYKSMFGELELDILSYEAVQAEEMEAYGMGMSYHADSSMTSAPTGVSVRTPGIISELRRVRTRTAELVALLRDEDQPAPWIVLEELSGIVAKAQRLPDFSGLDSLKASIANTDELTQFIRRARVLTDVLAFLPCSGVDLSIPLRADFPARPETPQEALEELTSLGPAMAIAETKQGLSTG